MLQGRLKQVSQIRKEVRGYLEEYNTSSTKLFFLRGLGLIVDVFEVLRGGLLIEVPLVDACWVVFLVFLGVN